jgi:hypothetical protein
VGALADHAEALYAGLLGGAVPPGGTAVDVVTWARDAQGPVTSGVLWRLVVQGDAAAAAGLGEMLAVARERKRGLLVNPHMDAWLAVVRTPEKERR